MSTFLWNLYIHVRNWQQGKILYLRFVTFLAQYTTSRIAQLYDVSVLYVTRFIHQVPHPSRQISDHAVNISRECSCHRVLRQMLEEKMAAFLYTAGRQIFTVGI